MNNLAFTRFDLYGPVHKGLRAFMADTLQRLGCLDVEDAAQVRETCQQALDLLALLRSHVDHEDEFIHPVLERCGTGRSLQVAHEHEDHRRCLEALAVDVRGLLAAPSYAAANALYQNLAELMADNLQHMHLEDVSCQGVLWQHCTDAELAALDGHIVASIPPKEMMQFLRWMIPAMSPPQRLRLMRALRAGAPAMVHAAVARMAQQILPAAAWQRLVQDLEGDGATRAAS